MTFAGALLIVAALTLVSVLTGRLVVGGFGADLLRRFDPPVPRARSSSARRFSLS